MIVLSITLAFLMKSDRWRDIEYIDILRSCYKWAFSHQFCTAKTVTVSQAWIGLLSDHIPQQQWYV